MWIYPSINDISPPFKFMKQSSERPSPYGLRRVYLIFFDLIILVSVKYRLWSSSFYPVVSLSLSLSLCVSVPLSWLYTIIQQLILFHDLHQYINI
jgi:hypothetical protein